MTNSYEWKVSERVKLWFNNMRTASHHSSKLRNLSFVWFDTWHCSHMCAVKLCMDLFLSQLVHVRNQRKIIRQIAVWRKRASEKYEKLRHLLDGKLHSSLYCKYVTKISPEEYFMLDSAVEAWKTFARIYFMHSVKNVETSSRIKMSQSSWVTKAGTSYKYLFFNHIRCRRRKLKSFWFLLASVSRVNFSEFIFQWTKCFYLWGIFCFHKVPSISKLSWACDFRIFFRMKHFVAIFCEGICTWTTW